MSRNLKEQALDLQLSSISFTDTADVYGQRERLGKVQRFTPHYQGKRNDGRKMMDEGGKVILLSSGVIVHHDLRKGGENDGCQRS